MQRTVKVTDSGKFLPLIYFSFLLIYIAFLLIFIHFRFYISTFCFYISNFCFYIFTFLNIYFHFLFIYFHFLFYIHFSLYIFTFYFTFTFLYLYHIWHFGNEYLRSRLKEIINPFWKDVFQSLCDFVTLLPKRNISAVLKSPLWHNCFIKIDKRPIFIKKWHDSGITFIQDLFTNNGDFMTLYDFQQKI